MGEYKQEEVRRCRAYKHAHLETVWVLATERIIVLESLVSKVDDRTAPTENRVESAYTTQTVTSHTNTPVVALVM